ncbi:uncharacterized protein LOC132304821 [Cornus florida]|uniref:uncharacterized protein LOC132304821 n=1 Tax=Cornus florida TaxID=4283 RepID=UPI0028A15233|nr:uncharacterized protein LOC132304821 [Cornus florida]
MNIGKEKLRPTRSPLVGFTGDKFYPLGAVILPITAGTSPKQVMVMVDFLAVDCPSAYNVILGRTTLNSMRAITSTYHLLMRFPTEQGVSKLRGDLTTAKECYVASLREKKQHNQDVFAWSHEDMSGIDPATIEHRLDTDPTVKPIRQKRRTFATERNMAISKKVNKLLKADFIQEVNYPDWLANVVLVKRPMENGGYNQILMHPPDREKTSFVMDRGLYCYKVMPFRLKNAGATYQRLVNLMFKNQIERNTEVYVDDMLERDRANPEKIQAILNMRSPASTKELQRLTRRIAALNRLISRATDRCLPFFRVLRKAFSWTPECEQAFTELKEYLTSPPLLSWAMQGDQLYLYLAVSPSAVSSALVHEEDGIRRPVYYTSRVFRGAEERQVLRKPDTSGQLIKWSIELGEFDIQYKPRTALKAKHLPDVIVEFTPKEGHEHGVNEQEETESTWTLYMDGTVNACASGAGLVIVSPNGECIKYVLRFGFKATNNEAEYEALLAGLRIAKALEVERLLAYTDSQVITGQVQGEYEAKDEKMKTYLHKIEDIKGFFKKFSIHWIPREDNKLADALAPLATAEEDKAIPVGYLDEPSTVWDWPQKIHQVIPGMEWAEPIIRYIENEELPQDRMEARKIRMRAAKYCLIEGVLY